VVLTGIETASYGRDLQNFGLADLLCEIDRIPNIGRVRLGSLDPSLIKQPFVDAIAALPSVVPHFHLSMQSGSDRILAAMKRKYNSKMALENMERLRRAMPDVQFTTDMIAGFPGETEESFAETLAFIEQARFLMIHAFPYSKRKGTVAADLPDQVPEEIKHARVAAISKLQAKIRAEILAEQIGSTAEVLFETYKNGIAYGHTPNFIEVSCPSPCPLTSKLLPVHILAVKDDRCIGELI
jgi:threonylcarbamoyladenosine tRNA methylthiotransferase MtaB